MGFPEPDLPTAATNCYLDLIPTLSNANDVALGTRPTTLAFCTALATTFPAGQKTANPVADLLAVLWSQATLLPVPDGNPAHQAPTPQQFSEITLTIYKMLWLTDSLQTLNQISSAQAAAVLAAYNTAFSVG